MPHKLVVVTGGSGYIGSHTIIELLNSGFEVVSIDNFSRSSPKSFDYIEKICGKRVRNFSTDLCDAAAVTAVLASLDGVAGLIHFAAFKSVPESVAQPELYYRNNILSLLNVLEGLRNAGISNLVFSSSCSVYGDIASLPVSEHTKLSEPKSPYAATKVMGERIVKDVCTAHGINAMCLRYFNPVGAHPSGQIGEMPLNRPNNLVPVITQTAIGKRESMTVYGGELPTRDGSCVRDYVHVTDIARAHVLAMQYLQNKPEAFEIVNLGTGSGVSVLEAIRTFEEISGAPLSYTIGPAREGDVVEIFSDVEKAEKLLGWKAQYGIRDMMASAWRWELQMQEMEQELCGSESQRRPPNTPANLTSTKSE